MVSYKNAVKIIVILSQLGSPVLAQDMIQTQVSKLEKEIIQSHINGFDRQAFDKQIAYSSNDVPLENNQTATINIVYDKKENRYINFRLIINGQTKRAFSTIEMYSDHDLDGLTKAEHKDFFTEYDSKCGVMKRGNRIDEMSRGNLRELNKRYMHKLRQTNDSLHRRKY